MTKLSKGLPQQKIKKSKKIFFDTDIAKKYGVENAIIIQHFQYSIDHHKRNGSHFHEGRFWTYNSIKSLTAIYPFWTTMIIRRIMKHLEYKKILLTGNFNTNKSDRTKWFSFKDEDEFLTHYESNESTEKPIVSTNLTKTVDESVDNYINPVDNPVDILGINNIPKIKNKTLGNEPIIPEFSSERRRNGHLFISTNGNIKNESRERANYSAKTPGDPQEWSFVHINKSSSIYIPIYSSMDEAKQPNNNHGGNLKKGFGRKNTGRPVFASKITKDYVLHKTLRVKLHKLGYTDQIIDLEIQNMIKYHEANPQIVLNEHKCVLGWFKNSFTLNRLVS